MGGGWRDANETAITFSEELQTRRNPRLHGKLSGASAPLFFVRLSQQTAKRLRAIFYLRFCPLGRF